MMIRQNADRHNETGMSGPMNTPIGELEMASQQNTHVEVKRSRETADVVENAHDVRYQHAFQERTRDMLRHFGIVDATYFLQKLEESAAMISGTAVTTQLEGDS